MTGKLGGVLAVLAVLAMWVGGCAKSAEPGPRALEIDISEYGRMHQAAVEILRDRPGGVTVSDYRFGQVVGGKEPLPTVVEFWRGWGRPMGEAFGSTLNNRRQQITVTLDPVHSASGEGKPTSYMLEVEALVEQFQSPTQYMTGAINAHQVMDRLWTLPQELKDRQLSDAFWRPLGRDEDVERLVLAQIVRKSLTVRPSHQATEDVLPPEASPMPDSTAPPLEGLLP